MAEDASGRLRVTGRPCGTQWPLAVMIQQQRQFLYSFTPLRSMYGWACIALSLAGLFYSIVTGATSLLFANHHLFLIAGITGLPSLTTTLPRRPCSRAKGGAKTASPALVHAPPMLPVWISIGAGEGVSGTASLTSTFFRLSTITLELCHGSDGIAFKDMERN